MTTTKAKHMGSVTVIITNSQDDSVKTEIRSIKLQVLEIMDHVEEYISINSCEQFIRSTRYEYIFIIATADSIENVFTQNLHQIPHVQSILLFDSNQNVNQFMIEFRRKSSYKMQERFLSSNDLVKCLWKCVHEYVHHSDLLLSSLSVCSLDAMTTNVVNNIADFAEHWFPLYIDLLLELLAIDPDAEVKKFADETRKQFVKRPGAIKTIDEMEDLDAPYAALYYYTGDTFMYRLVNRALRRQATDVIRDFRFFSSGPSKSTTLSS